MDERRHDIALALGVLVALPNVDTVSAELTRLGGRSEAHVISDEEMTQADTAAEAAVSAQVPTESSGYGTTPQA